MTEETQQRLREYGAELDAPKFVRDAGERYLAAATESEHEDDSRLVAAAALHAGGQKQGLTVAADDIEDVADVPAKDIRLLSRQLRDRVRRQR